MLNRMFLTNSLSSSELSESDVTCYGVYSISSAVNATTGFFKWSDYSKITNVEVNIQNKIVSFDYPDATKVSYMFYKSEAASIVFNKLNTSGLTSLSSMFGSCKSLTTIKFISFNTSNITSLSSMFGNCTALTSIDLSSFDTSKVTAVNTMFSGCTALTSINLSSFDTSKVTTMMSMFSGCTALTSIDLSSFDTSKVTTMANLFQKVGYSTTSGCTINCPQGLDMSGVTTVSDMFSDAKFAKPIHLKNIRKSYINLSGSSSSDWTLTTAGGTCGVHYIIDSVI